MSFLIGGLNLVARMAALAARNVATMTMSPSTVTAYAAGDPVQLRARPRVANGLLSNAAVSWSSSDESIATVDSTGLVTPLAVGSVTITATAGVASATCALTVADNTLGLPQLAATLAAEWGASVVGAYHGSVVTQSGGLLTAWPDARGAGNGPTLPVNTTNKPAYNATTKSFALTQAGAEALLYTGAGFGAITDNVAVIVVMTKPTNYIVGRQQSFLFDMGTSAGSLMQAYNDNTVAGRVKYFGGPNNATLDDESTELPSETTRMVMAFAQWFNPAAIANSSNARRVQMVQMGRNAPSIDTWEATTDVANAVNALGLFQHRSGTFGGGLDVAEVAAVLVVKLDPAQGYGILMQEAVNAWAEQYAGAVALTPPTTALSPGDDIQAAVTAAPVGTVFALAAGTYLSQSVTPKIGQSFVGPASGARAILDGQGVTAKAFQGAGFAVRLAHLDVVNYAPAASSAPVQGDYNESVQWLVDDCDISLSPSAGLYVTDDMVVRNVRVHHNGTIGLLGKGNRCVIEDSEIDNNNTAHNDPTNEAGGMKILYSDRAIVRRCAVHDNYGPGIWFDTNNIRCLAEDNECIDNAYSGVFFEVSYSMIARRNTVSGSGIGGSIARAGIQVAASRDCEVYENVVLANAHAIAAIANDRSAVADVGYGAHLVTGLNVHDNDISQPNGGVAAAIDDQIGDGAVYQPAANNVFDHNHYDVTGNAEPFDGPNQSDPSAAAWVASGYDVDSTFAGATV